MEVQRIRVEPPQVGDWYELEEVVVNGVFPDLDGFWDGDKRCWYLNSVEGREPNWETHIDCIRLAGGRVTWIQPEGRDVNPSGRAPFGWHL